MKKLQWIKNTKGNRPPVAPCMPSVGCLDCYSDILLLDTTYGFLTGHYFKWDNGEEFHISGIGSNSYEQIDVIDVKAYIIIKHRNMKKIKKLERQLLAAGIEVLFDEPLNCKFIGNGKNDNTMCIDNEDDLPTFKQCKEFVDFKGNDWDGLYERLKKDDQWEAKHRNIYCYSNKYHENNATFLHVDDCSVMVVKTKLWIDYKPHQIWKLLDKIDDAKAKGGKQIVKFKGCEYEFDFPVVNQVADTTVIEKEVNPVLKGDHKNIIVQDCKIGNAFKKEDTNQSLAPNGNAIHCIDEVSEVTDTMMENMNYRVMPELRWNVNGQGVEYFGNIGDKVEVEIIPPIKHFLGFTECDNIKPYWELTDEQKKVLTNKDVLFIVEGASDGKWVAKYIKAEETNDVVEDIKEPANAEWKKVTDYASIALKTTTGKGFYQSGYYAANEKQAKAGLVFSKITQIHKAIIDASEGILKTIDVHGLWVQSIDLYQGRYSFDEYLYEDLSSIPYCTPFEIQFYSKEQRDHFIKHNKQLIDQYTGRC